MIKNIVFDMGNVLISYDPVLFIQKYTDDPKTQQMLKENIFGTVEWIRFDRGTITKEGLEEAVLKKLPEDFHASAKKILLHWYEEMKPIEAMVPLIQKLKSKGYKIYLLSNTSADYYHFRKNVPALSLFDGEFISCEWHFIKPEAEIYRAFFSHFQLVPAQCFFIDDAAANIESGINAGMKGCIFRGDMTALASSLAEEGVVLD